jgi:hypothetical protein
MQVQVSVWGQGVSPSGDINLMLAGTLSITIDIGVCVLCGIGVVLSETSI